MLKAPPFTERAAAQLKRLSELGESDDPPGKYMPCVGWELGLEKDFVPRPTIGGIEAHLVPEHLQIECHGVRLAYGLPDRILAAVQSSILDFDGRQFRFVECSKFDEAD